MAAIKVTLYDAIELYKKGSSSALKCADEAEISLWEFLDELKKRRVEFTTDEMELENFLRDMSHK
jgi:predicted HTH domain antitoxin